MILVTHVSVVGHWPHIPTCTVPEWSDAPGFPRHSFFLGEGRRGSVKVLMKIFCMYCWCVWTFHLLLLIFYSIYILGVNIGLNIPSGVVFKEASVAYDITH